MAVPNPDEDLSPDLNPSLVKRVGYGGPLSPTTHDQNIASLEAKVAELVSFVNKLKSGVNIEANAIDTDHLTDGKITTAKLVDQSVTGAKIADDTVTGTQLSNVADVAGTYPGEQTRFTVDEQGRVSGIELPGSVVKEDGLFDSVAAYTADAAAGLTWHPIDTSAFPTYSLGANNPLHDTFQSLFGHYSAVRLPSPTGHYWGATGFEGGAPVEDWGNAQYFKNGSGGSGTGYTHPVRVQFGPYVPDTAKAVLMGWNINEAVFSYCLEEDFLTFGGTVAIGRTIHLATGNASGINVFPLERPLVPFISDEWQGNLQSAVGDSWVNEWPTRVYQVKTGESLSYQEIRHQYRINGAAKTTDPEEGLGDYSWTDFCPAKPYVSFRITSSEGDNNTFGIGYVDLYGYWA